MAPQLLHLGTLTALQPQLTYRRTKLGLLLGRWRRNSCISANWPHCNLSSPIEGQNWAYYWADGGETLAPRQTDRTAASAHLEKDKK
jgi:hypothetical protein